MRQLFRELIRRNVYKAAVAYVVAAFSANKGVHLQSPGEAVTNVGDREAARWTS